MTWPEAQARAETGAILLLPIGSTEQHGPHLPLSTDTDIAVALADRLDAVRSDVVIAPALTYGSSGEHAGFAGTISIGQTAIEEVLVEWARSASATFSRLVWISAHGGNATSVERAAARLRAESRPVLVWAPRWHGDAHAGFEETSLQLALQPNCVRRDQMVTGNVEPLEDLWPVLAERGVKAVSTSGVLGDPSAASADDGSRLLDRFADHLIGAVDTFLRDGSWRGGAE